MPTTRQMSPALRESGRAPLALAVMLACGATAVQATTITVTSGDDVASFAPCNLRNAITAINYGNAVLFPGCQVSLSGAFGDNDTIVFAPSLANSTITLQQGQLSNYAPLTIAGSGQTIDGAGIARVLYTKAFTALSNLTMTGGTTSGRGGGLYGSQASVMLTDVTLSGNHASTGGGLAVSDGNATLVRARLTGNSTSNPIGGAGLYSIGSTLTLSETTVSGNTAQCAFGYCGGGIVADGSNMTISASTISGNSALAGPATGNVAGALYSISSNVRIINSTLAGNSATGSYSLAGALIANHPTSTVFTVSLTNSTVSANVATSSGNGAAITGGALVGAYHNGHLALANTILAANSVIIAGNTTAAPDLAVTAGSATAANSLLGAALLPAYAGNGNVFNDDAGLAQLADRGGPTQTMALFGTSPAIDAGSNALAVNALAQPLTTDQRGLARVVNGSVDIGAFEYPGDHIFSDGFGS